MTMDGNSAKMPKPSQFLKNVKLASLSLWAQVLTILTELMAR